MDQPLWLEIATAVESCVKAAAIILGGGWAIYRFGLGREKEPALAFELDYAVGPYAGETCLVTFDVTVANKSRVKLAASAVRPAYSDRSETLNYAASLLLRRVPPSGTHGMVIKWFDGGQHSPRADDIELDLLNDYLADQVSEFYMEPGESYRLSASVFLNPGVYMAMVTFVGATLPDDFWRRTRIVTVDQTSVRPPTA